MKSKRPWKEQFFQRLYKRYTSFGYNKQQMKAIEFIFNSTNNLPSKSSSKKSFSYYTNKHPRLQITKEQHHFRELSYKGILVTHQFSSGSIVIGPPGTGKTELICLGALLNVFQQGAWSPHPKRKTPYPNKYLLIGTFTNAGSERVIEKIFEIAQNEGFEDEIHQAVKLVQSETRMQNYQYINVPDPSFLISSKRSKMKTEEQWKNIIRSHHIYVGTTFSLSRLSRSLSSAHTIIVDEASQLTVPQLNLLVPSFKPNSLIVVGDDKQLPPVAQLKPLSLSALTYLMGTRTFQNIPIPKSRIITLVSQYRMHPAIGQLTENILGNIRVVEHGPNTRKHLLENPRPTKLPIGLSKKTLKFLDDILNREKTVVVLDTSNLPNALNVQLNNSRINPMEANIVKIIYCYLRMYYPLSEQDIIVTSPYSKQKELIRNKKKGIRSGTIHSFQGQEAEAVIYSLTFAEPGIGSSFFSQLNLMYVGLSRAKRKLIVIGNQQALDGNNEMIEIKNAIFQFSYDHSKLPLNFDPVCHKLMDINILNELEKYI